MKIIQHVPTFVECEPKKGEFSTLEELLNIDFVKYFSTEKDFYRFSVSNLKVSHLLMAEQENGLRWWVVGNLIDAEEIISQLPEWEAKYKVLKYLKE